MGEKPPCERRFDNFPSVEVSRENKSVSDRVANYLSLKGEARVEEGKIESHIKDIY